MALQFPDIRPDIFTIPALHFGNFSLGPFPLRWYALAYIAGILLGWRYALGLVSNAKLWKGRPAGHSGPDRRPDPVDHPGRHPGRADRLSAVLHAAHSPGGRPGGPGDGPDGGPAGVAWRDELPRRDDRGGHRPSSPTPCASACPCSAWPTWSPPAPRSACSSAASPAASSTASCGGGRPTSRGG